MSIQKNTPLSSVQELAQFYHLTNPKEQLLIGIELERSSVYRDGLSPVPFDGDSGYQAVFRKLQEEVGWEVTDEDHGMILEMQRGKASLTIESDGRPELAGSPREHVHELSREFRLHDNELREIGNIFDIGWVPIGLEPFHSNDEICMIAKKRYTIIQNSFDTAWVQTHLKRENGVHVNFSYLDEQNMIRKAQTAFRILPIIGAIYASSPFSEGTLGSHLCMRRHNEKCTDAPKRNLLPTNLLDPTFSFEQWIEHYINLPVVIIVREGEEDHSPKDLTFKQWMENGYNGTQPTPQDFDQHIKTCWSDIRLRTGYLEYRVADSTPESLAMSLPALLKGLLFDSSSWDAVEELTKDWTYDRIHEIDREACTHGLQTDVNGKKLLTYAQELITIANEKLHGFERTEATQDDETVFLAPLKEQIFIKEKSPAQEMRDLWEGDWNQNPARILEWCEQRV